jgi:class 3 adenylate cyclase
VPFSGAPPGMPVHQMRIGLAGLKAGLRVPLIAQHEVVGLMIVHAAYKAGFAPGEVALLQAFANQAAVALQRAGLIDALRDKIAQLEAAQAELVEKEFIKDTFGKAVDPRVRDHLLSGHIKLGGELREATILFVDIRGFTPLSEKMKPDQVVALLNRYFEKMTRCIIEEEGLVNRYIGDAILAIFGAPVHMDNHADAAVRAALTMRAARDALNEDMQQEGLPPIYTGIGIHTGPVLAGNIGSSSRMEYTVIGDTVNLASRIEKLCKALGRDFIMSEATAMQLSAAFAPAYLDTVKIQGKQQLIKVFYL